MTHLPTCRHCKQRLIHVKGGTGRYQWVKVGTPDTAIFGSGSECPDNERGHEPEEEWSNLIPPDPFLDHDAPPSRLLDDVDPAWGLARSHDDHPLNVEYREMCENIRRNAERREAEGEAHD
jgi:hypothetical protein